MNKRKIALGMVGLGLVSAYNYLNDQPMQRAQSKTIGERYIIADLHAHPAQNQPESDLEQMLRAPGLVALTVRKGVEDATFSYEEAVAKFKDISDFQEIESDQLARLGEGYFLRSQEIEVGPNGQHHLVVWGWQGEYFDSKKYTTVDETIRDLHSHGAFITFAHPYSIQQDSIVAFRLPNSQAEEDEIDRICTLVDAVEVHNAHNVRLYVPLLIDNMHEANERAAKLQMSHCHGKRDPNIPLIRLAGSDAHNLAEQVGIVGAGIPQSILLSTSYLQDHLKANPFPQVVGSPEKGPYVSRFSFVNGIFLP
ncbi:hypothetical protein HYV86_07090 [Candidatus Woesearchaeota archaeon]|nr:hypothetical protein [Candidatus Woesearchaeota archaeon]